MYKTPGTEVIDNRNSTSYSGAESSWAPSEKYGGETFVHQSVWSDNEYDVSFGNKPRDVIGLDALDDNIISDNFPDDDEKLFGANEFIDLNQDPETGMGLNFQARKA